jgi:hypothetical protein
MIASLILRLRLDYQRPANRVAGPGRLVFSTLLVLLGLMTGWTTSGYAAVHTFVSDTSWSVADAASNPLGPAQFVCLSATVPPSCPVGATLLSPSAIGWAANLSTIPGAHWILAPGITGATPNASLAQFSFSKTFNLAGAPVSGTISVAVDDFAQVIVNGTPVGSTGSITNAAVAAAAANALTVFDITPFLVTGANTIKIAYQNGPDSFSVPNANWSQNPGAVVFGGTLNDSAAPVPVAMPTLSVGSLIALIGILLIVTLFWIRRSGPKIGN